MPHLPPLSRFARRLPASSTIVILLPTPQINHSISNGAFPFVRRSAKLDSQGTFLLVLPMILLDDVASGLWPRSDSTNCIPSPSAVTVTMAWYSGSATLQARDVWVLDQCFTRVPLIIIIPPLVDFLSMAFRPVRVNLDVKFPPHHPRHLPPLSSSHLQPIMTSWPCRVLLALELTLPSSSLSLLPCPSTSSF